MDVARLNFSHGAPAWHRRRAGQIRALQQELGRPIAILQDLSGPKLRIGDLPAEGMKLAPGQEVLLTPESMSIKESDHIPVPLPALLSQLNTGQQIFLDDGIFLLEVRHRVGNGVRCEVINGGLLRSRKGIVAPGVALPIGAVTEKDLADLRLGLEMGVDWVAVSYVHDSGDLQTVRAALDEAGADTPIIAKIENREAVENLEAILAAADGVMVARGDLGVELPLYRVPILQKEIISRTVAAGKPVITATQMLESMQNCPRPTRAEVSDVANAILDGTSAVMLSAETAIGQYPAESVAMMDEIAEHTEASIDYGELSARLSSHAGGSITEAISHGVAQIAGDLDAACILCSTSSGFTARMVSRTRPRAPIVAATASPETHRRLCLIWGVRSLLMAPTHDTDAMLRGTIEGALAAGWIQKGDTVVIASASPVGTPGRTNLIKVDRI